jgi:acetyltransferase (GNAT) family protein
MYVTRHNSVVERGLLERLWELYELAYRRTAEESATREMLFRSEFDAAVADSRNRLWVLWADEEPVAMVLIATDIGATRYLSRPFFERQFTDHSRRGAVHYILFVVVHPRFAAKGALTRMARDVLGAEAAEGVLLVFDSPQINQPREDGGTALLMERLARMVTSGAPVIPLDVSRYYGIDFAASTAYAEAERDARIEATEPARTDRPTGVPVRR